MSNFLNTINKYFFLADAYQGRNWEVFLGQQDIWKPAGSKIGMLF